MQLREIHIEIRKRVTHSHLTKQGYESIIRKGKYKVKFSMCGRWRFACYLVLLMKNLY